MITIHNAGFGDFEIHWLVLLAIFIAVIFLNFYFLRIPSPVKKPRPMIPVQLGWGIRGGGITSLRMTNSPVFMRAGLDTKRDYRGPCESCGTQISEDPNGGGTERNGDPSNHYCSFCYEKGKFRFRGYNVREFRKTVIDAMVENGAPGWMARLHTLGIPRRPRWKGTAEKLP